jgi:hypothetical protein
MTRGSGLPEDCHSPSEKDEEKEDNRACEDHGENDLAGGDATVRAGVALSGRR